MHKMRVTHVKSSFPLAVGTTVTGVDDCTYSSTGQPYSMITLPNAESSSERTLQEDDISLAYEFSRKFPGVCRHFQTWDTQIRSLLLRLLTSHSRVPVRSTRRTTFPRRASTRSRPAALCLSLLSTRAILKPPLLRDRSTHPSPSSPAATRSCPRSRRMVWKLFTKPRKNPAQPTDPHLTSPPALLQTADKLQVRNSMQSLHSHATSRSRLFLLLRRWARSR